MSSPLSRAACARPTACSVLRGERRALRRDAVLRTGRSRSASRRAAASAPRPGRRRGSRSRPSRGRSGTASRCSRSASTAPTSHASCPREDGYTASRPCLVSAVAWASKRRPITMRRYSSRSTSDVGQAGGVGGGAVGVDQRPDGSGRSADGASARRAGTTLSPFGTDAPIVPLGRAICVRCRGYCRRMARIGAMRPDVWQSRTLVRKRFRRTDGRPRRHRPRHRRGAASPTAGCRCARSPIGCTSRGPASTPGSSGSSATA